MIIRLVQLNYNNNESNIFFEINYLQDKICFIIKTYLIFYVFGF
jgi:hypothetical protein